MDTEPYWHRRGAEILGLGLDAQGAAVQPVLDGQPRRERPDVVGCLADGDARSTERAIVVRAGLVDGPRTISRDTVDGVWASFRKRHLILGAAKREAPVTDAIWPREHDRDAVAANSHEERLDVRGFGYDVPDPTVDGQSERDAGEAKTRHEHDLGLGLIVGEHDDSLPEMLAG
jgi:hypothetical protein